MPGLTTPMFVYCLGSLQTPPSQWNLSYKTKAKAAALLEMKAKKYGSAEALS